MLKLKAKNVIVFGLSDNNMTELKNGSRIKFELNAKEWLEFDEPVVTFIIFNGKTEVDMQKEIHDLFSQKNTSEGGSETT